MTTSWPPNIQQQTMIRASVKLDFAWGVALRMAAAINAVDPETMRMIGEIWSYAEFTRAAVLRRRDRGARVAERDVDAGGPPLHALRAILPLWLPRVNEILRLIGSHNLFATPTAAQMADPDLRPLIDRYLPGAKGMAGGGAHPDLPAGLGFRRHRAGQPQRAVRALLSRLVGAQHGASPGLHRPQPRRRLVERFLKEPY